MKITVIKGLETILKRKNSLFLVILVLLVVGLFYSSGPNLQEFIVFIILTALLGTSAYFTRYYYMTDRKSLKQSIISICMSFIIFTVYYVAVNELTGFLLDYTVIVMMFFALLVSTLWERLNLIKLEKGVLVLTLVAVLGVMYYEGTVTTPATAIQFYRSELEEGLDYENIRNLLMKDYQEEFTTERFNELKPYLQQTPLRYNQPAILEFKDGQLVRLEVSHDQDKLLRINKIELLPEEIASYFRFYPLEIERQASFPRGKEADEAIIGTRGAFVSRASFYQEREWYEQLLNVFGEKRVWDELWKELDGLRAPEGPIQGAGTNKDGYLEFRFHEEWKVDQEVLDEVYALFSNKALEHGIKDLPVVFKF